MKTLGSLTLVDGAVLRLDGETISLLQLDRDSAERRIYDMYGAPLRPDDASLGAHEGSLEGLVPPAFDWFAGARQGVAGPYPADGFTSPYAQRATVWGAHNAWNICLPVGGPAVHTVANVRVHYDRLEICHLNVKAGAWTIIRQGEATMAKKNLSGGFFQASPFRKMLNLGAHYRKEPSGWSVDLSPTVDLSTGKPVVNHALVHTFWPDLFPRIQIGDGLTKGTHQIAIRIKARLFSDDPSVDVSQAQFMTHTSGDMFRAPSAGTDPSGVNPPLANPRYRLLTPDWQYFGLVTGSSQDIAAYPPIPFVEETA